MLTASRIAEEVDGYHRRVDELYAEVRNWISERRPDAVFQETQLELSEEATGVYQIQSLDVVLPGSPSVRFIPRGIFMVGARGRVDVRSRLGREVLVWLASSGPALNTTEMNGNEIEEIISRPIFGNVTEGWAWTDSRHAQVLPLSAQVVWDRILGPLTQ